MTGNTVLFCLRSQVLQPELFLLTFSIVGFPSSTKRQQRQQSGVDVNGNVNVRGRKGRRSEAVVAEQSVGQVVKAARHLASQLSSSGEARQEEEWQRREMTRETGELGLKDESLSGVRGDHL